jgi:methylated-DNA-[protein]-cysteine S-methyltransferase
MAGRGYCTFDSTVGRYGIAWGGSGILGVQLPEAREIETRRRMLRQYPDARDLAPPPMVEIAIDGIAALLRGKPCDFSDVVLDMNGTPPFNRRVYEYHPARPNHHLRRTRKTARRVRRGERRRPGDRAKSLYHPGALPSRAGRRRRDR